MGYTTDFSGSFQLDKPLTLAQKNYLEAFAHTRRMGRNANLAAKLPDPIREAVNLSIGIEGGYFVGDTADFGQGHTPDILDFNRPPKGQPSLWTQWVPSEDGTEIQWDGGEKFYSYVEWLEYLIEHFLKPWGLKLNGVVTWQGEDSSDLGQITVKNNKVTVKEGHVVYR